MVKDKYDIDITKTPRGKRSLKIIREYENLIKKGLVKEDITKIPSFSKFVEKKYGTPALSVFSKLIKDYPNIFYSPNIKDARETLLKNLITKANQGEKVVNMIDLFPGIVPARIDKRGKGAGLVRHLLQKYKPTLEKIDDKVRKVFDRIVDADEIIKWPEKATKYSKNTTNPLYAMIAERTGVSGGQLIGAILAQEPTAMEKVRKTGTEKYTKPGLYKPKHVYDKKLLKVATRSGFMDFNKPYSEIIEEAKYRAGGGVIWDNKGITPDAATSVNDFALRHWDHHKKHKTKKSQIEFFWKKKKDGKIKAVDWEKVRVSSGGRKQLKMTDVFFKYTKDPLHRPWSLEDIRNNGRKSELFDKVYAARNKYQSLLRRRVPDPNNPNTKISFETLMKRIYKKGYDNLGNVYAVDHEKLVADKPFRALRVVSQRLNNQLRYISHHVKQKDFKRILTNALDLTELDDPLEFGKKLGQKVLVEGYKTPLNPTLMGTQRPGKRWSGPQELAHKVLTTDIDQLSRPMVNQMVGLFSKSNKLDIVRPIVDEVTGGKGAKICGIIFGKGGKRFGSAAGGVPGYPNGCADEVKQAFDENPDELFKKVAGIKQKGGALGRASNWARNILNKVPKGGRLGAILAGAGAVGAGTYAMFGGSEAVADEPTMKFNATEGRFVDNEEIRKHKKAY